MLFGQDRTQLRKIFFESWRKYRTGEPLQPLEQLIAEIIKFHPEYHAAVENPDAYQDKDYLPGGGETNPFLHMGMHISIQEQLSTDRPTGFVDLYKTLMERIQDPHQAEHQIMECLAESLWQAQRTRTVPDESQYMACLRRLLGQKD